jgi:hypothetical protein
MNPPFNRRIAVAVGLGLITVTLVGVVILARSHRGPAYTAAATSTNASSASRPGSASPSVSSSPTSPNAAATTPTAGATPPANAPTEAPAPPAPPPPPPPPPAYAFAPPFTAGTASTAATLVAADLSGGLVAATFSVTSPGPVYLHGFGSVSALIGCLGPGPNCSPGQIPNPGYWTLNADDLAHSTTYTIRVSVPGNAGLDFGWNGPKTLAMSGLGMNGACATGGYQLGCGVRLRLNTAGTVSMSASPVRFHTKARDKAAGAVVPASGDTSFTGSTTLSLPHSAAWTVYLWSDGPASAWMSISWP